jgi:hypothetical protein
VIETEEKMREGMSEVIAQFEALRDLTPKDRAWLCWLWNEMATGLPKHREFYVRLSRLMSLENPPYDIDAPLPTASFTADDLERAILLFLILRDRSESVLWNDGQEIDTREIAALASRLESEDAGYRFFDAVAQALGSERSSRQKELLPA